jgi:PAS domain S-box-containing protein
LIANRQFLEICGLPPSRQPSYEEFLGIVHPEDREYFQQMRAQALGVGGGCEFEFEYRVIGRANGRTRWVESHGRVVESAHNEAHRRVIGVLRDTTKRHDIDDLRKLAAGVIAHDLRSPLSAIRLSSEILMRGGDLPEAAVQKVQSIARKVDRMAHMVEQFLVYTQAQFGGGLPLDRELVDLGEVCRRAIDDEQAAYPASEIHLDVEGDCGGVWDRIRLIEVACNLVGNALKHGDRTQPIYVGARDEGEQVLLEVHNTGPAIPAELIPEIFEPFRRAGGRSRTIEGGYGLGLYIVREIVAAHDGKIEVSSSAARGTTFAVRLPRGLAARSAPHV